MTLSEALATGIGWVAFGDARTLMASGLGFVYSSPESPRHPEPCAFAVTLAGALRDASWGGSCKARGMWQGPSCTTRTQGHVGGRTLSSSQSSSCLVTELRLKWTLLCSPATFLLLFYGDWEPRGDGLATHCKL